MQIGKLTPEQLRKHVLKYLGAPLPSILIPAELGGDVTIIDTSGKYMALSTDPITGATDHAGWLALHVSANDVYACGAEPLGCLITILAPPDASLDDIEQVMRDADRAARELGIAICGGHTEITDAVNRLVLSATVVGTLNITRVEKPQKPQPLDDIVVCKSLGLEGSSIVARDHADKIREVFTTEEITEMAALIEQISIGKAAQAALRFGTVRAMHDVTEGGLLGALYEMAEGAGLGFEIDGTLAPLHPLVARLCAHVQLDPLRLLSSGTLLIASADGQRLSAELRSCGFEAAVLGAFTQNIERTLKVGADILRVEPPHGDELWRLLDRWSEN